MIEMYGDMWKFASRYDAICITTNWQVNKEGFAIMGKGCALEANRRYPLLTEQYGEHIKSASIASICVVNMYDPWLIMFPTKYHYWKRSDMKLIEKSSIQLMNLIDKYKMSKVLLPKPGCGLGGLEWKDVKKIIEPILDDRVHVVSNE